MDVLAYALRVLTFSAAGFVIGMGIYLGHRYIRYGLMIDGVLHPMPGRSAVLCGTISMVAMNAAAACELIVRLDDPISWRVFVYLPSMLLLVAMLLMIGRSVRKARQDGVLTELPDGKH